MRKGVGIVGGSGYVGGELLRILLHHNNCEVRNVSSRRLRGKPLSKAHPHLKGEYEHLEFTESSPDSFLNCDFVFIVSPQEEKSFSYVKRFHEAGIRAVDTTACYRTTPEHYERYYGKQHEDKERRLVYGLPEFNRDEIKSSKLVSNPGCIAASCILSAKPLDDKDLIEGGVFDAKVSVSCAGAEPYERTHFPYAAENVYQYESEKMPHRQTPEIKNNLRTNFTFVPHLVPIVRGILVTSYLKLKEGVDPQVVERELRSRYLKESFVRFVDVPSTTRVKNSNFFDIGNFYYEMDSNTLVFSSAVDNLVKGSAGVAVQNMNLMLDLDEREALADLPTFP